MKTKVIGSSIYMVKKYFTNENGDLSVIVTTWIKKEKAFRDCKSWQERYGEENAHVFKARLCIEAE